MCGWSPGEFVMLLGQGGVWLLRRNIAPRTKAPLLPVDYPEAPKVPAIVSLPLVSLTLGIILVLSVWLTVDKIVDLGRGPVAAQIAP